jgi:hypothetical protein
VAVEAAYRAPGSPVARWLNIHNAKATAQATAPNMIIPNRKPDRPRRLSLRPAPGTSVEADDPFPGEGDGEEDTPGICIDPASHSSNDKMMIEKRFMITLLLLLDG